MTVPYAPIAFDAPLINPSVGGFGVAMPYISCSQYVYAPTAMDTSSLVTIPGQQAQTQSLYETIGRASAWADRYVYGFDQAAKGASLAASLSVESAWVPIVGGELRLICDYKPIMELTGCDMGHDPSNVQSIGGIVANQVRFGRRTIYIPINNRYWFGPNGQNSTTPIRTSSNGHVYAVWSYVNGFPHTALAADVAAGAQTIELVATSATGGLFGVYPGTQLRIVDGVLSESVTVESVTGATITTAAPLAYAHATPAAPDFTPVTALPADVDLAVIFFTTALIKTRGDNSLVLDELTEPEHISQTAGNVEEDVAYAMELLDPYRIRAKAKN